MKATKRGKQQQYHIQKQENQGKGEIMEHKKEKMKKMDEMNKMADMVKKNHEKEMKAMMKKKMMMNK